MLLSLSLSLSHTRTPSESPRWKLLADTKRERDALIPTLLIFTIPAGLLHVPHFAIYGYETIPRRWAFWGSELDHVHVMVSCEVQFSIDMFNFSECHTSAGSARAKCNILIDRIDERQRELFDAQCCVLQRFDVFPWRAEARLRRNSSLRATSISGNKRV